MSADADAMKSRWIIAGAAALSLGAADAADAAPAGGGEPLDDAGLDAGGAREGGVVRRGGHGDVTTSS